MHWLSYIIPELSGIVTQWCCFNDALYWNTLTSQWLSPTHSVDLYRDIDQGSFTSVSVSRYIIKFPLGHRKWILLLYISHAIMLQ